MESAPRIALIIRFFFIFAAMKNIFAILSAVIVFASCSDKTGGWHSAPELRTAHELMQERPDSALKVLISFDIDDSTSRSVVNEYQILVAEALYKNDYQQTNAQAVIAATAYYDSVFEEHPKNSGLAFETARAHYYKAVGETEKDDIVAACTDYLKAADIMEEAFPEIAKAAEKGMMGDGIYEKIRFIGMIYNNLGIVLFNEQLPNLAAKMFKGASIYFKSIDDKSSVRTCFSNLAKSHVLCNRFDDAESVFDELLNDTIPSSTIIGDMAILDYNRSKSDESLNNIKTVINNIESKNERKRFEFALAEIYYDRQELDSAITYYTRSIDRNKYTKMRASECLGNIYKSLNDNNKSIYYDSIYKNIASTEIDRNIDRQDISTTIEKFFTKLQSRDIATKKKNYFFTFAILLSGSVLTIIIIRKRRVKKSFAREKELKTELEEVINKARQSELELSTLKDDQDKRNNMKHKLGSLNITEDFDAMKHNFETSDICKSLRNRFEGGKIQTKNIGDYRHLAMTKNEINDLMSTADKYLPMFGKILSENLGINKNNQPYCMLQLLNFSTAEVAVLMDVSYITTVKHYDFIKKKLCTTKNISNFLVEYLTDLYEV